MHDLLLAAHSHTVSVLIAAGSPEVPSSGGNDSTVKVAIVTAIGLVVATAITAFASTLKRNSAPVPTPTGPTSSDQITKQYIDGLEKDRVELTSLRITYGHLREACLERHLDPDDLIRDQRQQAASPP